MRGIYDHYCKAQFSVWTIKNKNRTLVADKDAIFCCFLGNTDYLRKPSFLTIAR